MAGPGGRRWPKVQDDVRRCICGDFSDRHPLNTLINSSMKDTPIIVIPAGVKNAMYAKTRIRIAMNAVNP